MAVLVVAHLRGSGVPFGGHAEAGPVVAQVVRNLVGPGVAILIADGEGLSIADGGETAELEQGDAVLIEPGAAATLFATRPTFVIAISILPV